MHNKFNDVHDQTIKIRSSKGKTYEVGLIKVFDKVLLGSRAWQKFVADHDLGRGDEVKFHFQTNEPHLVFGFKPIKDVYNNDEGNLEEHRSLFMQHTYIFVLVINTNKFCILGYNGCETMHPSVLHVASTKEVVHCATHVPETTAADKATSHHLYSFVHRISVTDVKYVLVRIILAHLYFHVFLSATCIVI